MTTSGNCRRDLTHDLILPTLLFVVLGGMTWAVRGCSGYGAMNGCIFAGVTWGAAWWFIARDPGGRQSRRYASGWIVLALAVGIGLSGGRGWMQWPAFFEGHLQINYEQGQFVPISRTYGFVWLFIAGVPWAGIGACMLAWCGSQRPTRAKDWAIRIACGIGAAVLARILFESFPEIFLPLFKTLKAQYLDALANPKTTEFPNLRRLAGDNRLAITHLGFYLGFLAYEIGRRDWKNVTLISTVGVVNGLGWSLCQNWKWAAGTWPGVNFNWWRCWESSGGLSIGLAYGLAYFLVNRPKWGQSPISDAGRVPVSDYAAAQSEIGDCPHLGERLGLHLGLILGLGFSIKSGLKGWANIYLGNEEYWSNVLWMVIGPVMLIGFVALVLWIRSRPLPKGFQGDVFPHAYALIWLVLIIQNILAQLVTGPYTVWNEMAFKLYYVFLFLISAVIICHEQFVKTHGGSQKSV